MAFLAGERAADQVERLLREREDRALVSAVNVAETVDVLSRRYGQPAETVSEKLDWLVAAPMQIVDADEVAGRLAGRLRAQHYHRTRAAISLGDAFALATAVLLERRLATADPALAAAATAEGIEIVPLPDSRGRLPV